MPASNFLVGTAPDQVPTNADLGEMAFQSKDAVEFTGGKGGLSHLDITAISAQLNVNATDIFVYDTSKDSDGGAWRNRCQHTSWFNETLNTATRGARREFPCVAIVVSAGTSLIIYDGDDPLLSMWMVFTQGGGWPANNILGQAGSGNVTSVFAMNAEVWFGFSSDGVKGVNFVSERARFYWGSNFRTYLGNIEQRNKSIGWNSVNSSTSPLPSTAVNDVAMTVLPNAPIDATTGLLVPTIAAATESGVSVINNDGLVANFTNEDPSYNATRYIQFNQKKQLQFVMDAVQRYLRTFNPPFAARTVSQWGAQYDDGITVGLEIPQFTANASYIRDIAENAIGTDLGVEVFSENTSNPAASLYAYIAAKYNSGWLVGDTKGAWLSDTAQETVVGSELVTNGDFASNLSGWTTSGTTAPSISNGGALLTTGAVDGEVLQAVSASQPRWWLISWTVTSNSGGYFGLSLNQSASQTGGFMALDQITTSGSFQYYGSITSIAFRHRSSGSGVIDNISLRPCDPDRSVNAKGLQVFGNITKTPVAAGADLVAYGGFSANSYLRQPYNLSLDFGTADFSFAFWADANNAGSLGGVHLVFAESNSALTGTAFGVFGGNTGRLDLIIGGVQYPYSDMIRASGWNHVVAVRRSGSFYLYVDGVLKQVNGNIVNLTGVVTRLYVGGYWYSGSFVPVDNKYALLRISATAPSDAQIKKMYEDEKYLFQDNAKATLYGTSDAVTALAYDEDTQLLHVGTSSGRSVFDGLRRVDNTTTAVSATISAANGLVVEN